MKILDTQSQWLDKTRKQSDISEGHNSPRLDIETLSDGNMLASQDDDLEACLRRCRELWPGCEIKRSTKIVAYPEIAEIRHGKPGRRRRLSRYEEWVERETDLEGKA